MTTSELVEKLRAAAAKCQSKDEDLDYKYWAAVAFDMLPKACEYIDERDDQIAALKKIAIGERSQKIYDEKFGHISISLPDDRDLFLERLKIADDEARDRLAKEYPKVDWK